ncbi:MAG: hypothetical protein ACLP9S_08045 [Syntrophales bacterium]|jgi:hypothetical protein
MGTGKERIRRWRERNKVEGRKSVTIAISKKAYHVLSEEKEKTGDNYGAIVERALLNIKRHKSLMDNVASNRIGPTATVTTKKLIDEGDYPLKINHSRATSGGIIFDAEETLNKGFLARLLKTSRRKLFKR